MNIITTADIKSFEENDDGLVLLCMIDTARQNKKKYRPYRIA